MDLKELQKIVSFCRKNGVTELKHEGIEIKLSAASLFPESQYKKTKALEDNKDPTSDETFSEEDALYWSSAGIPDEAN